MSVLILSIFGFQKLLVDNQEIALLLDLHLGAVIIAGLGLIYSTLLFRFLAKKKIIIAGYIAYLLLFFELGAMIVSSGGFESPYLLLWTVSAFFAGMFGGFNLFLAWLATNAYYALILAGVIETSLDPTRAFIYALSVELPFLVSYLAWHGQIQDPANQSVATDLSDSVIEPHMLINSIAEGVAVIDKEGKIKVFNPAAQILTGWQLEDATGIDYRSVLIMIDDKGNQILAERDPIRKVFNNGEAIVDNDIIISTRNNKQIEVSMVISPIKNKNGGVEAVVVVFRDITKEKNEERQRAEFISTASHEMRTPVAAIEGYLALARNENVAKIDSKAREYLDKAHAATQHLGKLFQDLLTAAKSEDGRLTYEPKVVDFGDFLDQLVEDARFAAQKKGLILEYESGKGSGPDGSSTKIRPIYYTHIDPERMREVITNLIDNAIKYTDEGKITVSLTGDDNHVEVIISDTGPGIPQEDIPHLFQKFYRVDNSATRQKGGTGLGLYIAKKIVELAGGKIWVESEVGKGSQFHVSLPRLSADKAAQMQKEEAAKATPLSNVVQAANLE